MPSFPPLYGHRISDYRIELLNSNGTLKSQLDGVTGGSIEYNYDSRLIAGGKLSVEETSQESDWLNDRIRIVAKVNEGSWGVGVFIPTFPGSKWSQNQRSWDVELHSILVALDQDLIEDSFTVTADETAVGAAKAVIESAGESSDAIEDPGDTPQTAMTWPPATPKLTVINDLLDAAGFFPLRIDGDGNLISEEYRKPKNRPVIEMDAFVYGENCLYVGEFTDSVDIFTIPNVVVAISKGSGSLPGWKGTAENTDEDDKYSIPSRFGRRIVRSYRDVEATSPAAITRFAEKMLEEEARPKRKIQIKHAPMDLQVTQVVSFAYSPGDIAENFVIEQTSINLDPTELQDTLLRSV